MNTPTIVSRLQEIQQVLLTKSLGSFSHREKTAYHDAYQAILRLSSELELEWQQELQDFAEHFNQEHLMK